MNVSVTHLVKIKNDIKLTDVTEELIQKLHKKMNTLQVGQLIVSDIHPHGEIQASVATINQFVIMVLQRKRID